MIAIPLTRLNEKDVVWKDKQQQAVQELKDHLMSPPTFGLNMYHQLDGRYILDTYASET